MKKFLFTLFITMLFTITSLFAGTYSGGNGTSGTPYQIATIDDLIELSNTQADWVVDTYFNQTADIVFNADETLVDWDGDGTVGDADDAKGFLPIGYFIDNSNYVWFEGNYDGQNHTISNLYINRPDRDYVGLFGRTSGVSISDLGLENVDITGNAQTGGFMGEGSAAFSNCYSTGDVSGYQYVGLFVGRCGGTFSDCYSNGNASGTYSVGGFAGGIYGNISNCYSSGNVSGIGIAGGFAASHIESPSNISISYCYSTCSVISSGNYVGGFVGANNHFISNCYSTGDVSGGNMVGGFVGKNRNDEPAEIEYCYSTGEVSGTGNCVGGFIGENEGGRPSAIVNGSYWNTDTCNQTSGAGSGSINATGLTTAQMQVQGNFTNLNFTNIWAIDGENNNGYPYLQWQTFASAPTAATNVFPENNSTEMPRTVTVNWRYSGSDLPTHFKVMQGGSQVGADIAYSSDILYNQQLNQASWGSTVNWEVIPYNSAGDCATPVEWTFTVMSEPANPDEEPTEVVYEEIEDYTGNDPDPITLPTIDFGNGPVEPVVDLDFTDNVAALDIPVQVQDQPNTPLPNPENCGAALNLTIPDGNQTRIVFNFRGDFQPTELVHLNGGVWEVVEEVAHTVVFTEGQVAFNWNIGGRGNEEFAVNGGGDSTLPIELSSFTAISTLENFAQLNWITQSETNLSGYNVYRNTTDSNENSLKMNGILISGNNTSSEQNYSFIDEEVENKTDYFYWLESIDLDGSSALFGPAFIRIENNDDGEEIPELTFETKIQSIFPNPFNPSATISFSLKEESAVEISVFNMKGQKVNNLEKGILETGNHSIFWNGKDSNGKNSPSGVYFFKMTAGNVILTERAILLK